MPTIPKLYQQSQKDRINYLTDVFSTFKNPNMFAVGMSKDSLLCCATKPILKQQGAIQLSRKSNVGEYRIYHTAMATLLISQIDALEGININTLRTATISQFHRATDQYYLDSTNADYVERTYNRVFQELFENGIITTGKGSSRARKIYLENASPQEFISLLYGITLNHATGISSWKRAFLTGLSTQHRGIDPSTIKDISQHLHNERLINKKDPNTFFEIHGKDGTGFILLDNHGGWWRCYDKSKTPNISVLQQYTPEQQQQISRALLTIQSMPFVGLKTLSKLYSKKTVQILEQIARHKANSLLVELSNSFVEARHVISLRLSQENLNDFDMLKKAQELWDVALLNSKISKPDNAILQTHNTLINFAESQKLKPKEELEEKICKWLTEIGYTTNEQTHFELNSENTSNFLKFLKFAGVRL